MAHDGHEIGGAFAGIKRVDTAISCSSDDDGTNAWCDSIAVDDIVSIDFTKSESWLDVTPPSSLHHLTVPNLRCTQVAKVVVTFVSLMRSEVLRN